MNKTIRKTVKIRANYLCEYCLSSEYFSPDPFECDHIMATSKGGTDAIQNLALSCSGCNGFKSDAIEAIDPANLLYCFLSFRRNLLRRRFPTEGQKTTQKIPTEGQKKPNSTTFLNDYFDATSINHPKNPKILIPTFT